MGCQQARLAVTNSGGLKTPPTPQLLTIINFSNLKKNSITKKLQLKKMKLFFQFLFQSFFSSLKKKFLSI
jgi:hypothetical protein